MAHTPGPWHIDSPSRSGAHHYWYVRDANGDYVVFLQQLEWNHEFQRFDANARLIAAAPDLYAALLDVLDACHLPGECPHDSEPDICDACAFAHEKALGEALTVARRAIEKAERVA